MIPKESKHNLIKPISHQRNVHVLKIFIKLFIYLSNFRRYLNLVTARYAQPMRKRINNSISQLLKKSEKYAPMRIPNETALTLKTPNSHTLNVHESNIDFIYLLYQKTN